MTGKRKRWTSAEIDAWMDAKGIKRLHIDLGPLKNQTPTIEGSRGIAANWDRIIGQKP